MLLLLKVMFCTRQKSHPIQCMLVADAYQQPIPKGEDKGSKLREPQGDLLPDCVWKGRG
jgi:hypothetical protein